jgi:hypothetical protein
MPVPFRDSAAMPDPETPSDPFVIMTAMSEIQFHPAYARVLAEVVQSALAHGEIDVECRPGLDPGVVASQVRRYSAQVGKPVRCVARADRVEVRALRRAG